MTLEPIHEPRNNDDEKVFIPEVLDATGESRAQSQEKETKARAGCALAGLSYFLMIVLGVVIYIWTIVIAYQQAGLIAALLSLIFPVLAQVFWGVQLWMARGTIINPYCLTLLGYLFATVLVRAGLLLFQNSMTGIFRR